MKLDESDYAGQHHRLASGRFDAGVILWAGRGATTMEICRPVGCCLLDPGLSFAIIKQTEQTSITMLLDSITTSTVTPHSRTITT